MNTLLIVAGSIIIVSVWVISAIIVLSYTRLSSYIKYIQAGFTFPVVGLLVTYGIIISARFIKLTQGWFTDVGGDVWFVVVMVLASFLVIVPVIALLFFGWVRLLGYLDSKIEDR